MMNQDEWLRSILTVVQIIADKKFQENVWLQGNCRDTSVISWEEAVSRFFDDSDVDDFISMHLAKAEFSEQQKFALQSLRDHFQAYIDKVPRVNGFIQPKALLSDIEWLAIICMAKETLRAFGWPQS